jgi:hypothetical protein
LTSQCARRGGYEEGRREKGKRSVRRETGNVRREKKREKRDGKRENKRVDCMPV